MKQAEKHIEELEGLYIRTVESLALAVDAKDQTTYGHIRRVRVYATKMAEFCGIKDANELKAIETGSLLHDIGKLAIDDYILNKPGRLSEQEFEKIKMHSVAGNEILKQIRFPYPVDKCVLYHHERYDGKGYPEGLKGEEIPLGARILTIADAYDAIRFSRPYKQPISVEEAVEILLDQRGSAFDPKLVDIFVQHIEELEQEAKIASENISELSFRRYFENVDRKLTNEDVALLNPVPVLDITAELLQIAEFCSTAAGHFDLGDFLSIISRKIERLVPFSTCAFYLDEKNRNVTAAYVSGSESEKILGHRMGMGKGVSGWVTAHRRPMIHADPLLDFHGLPGDFSAFKDSLVVPIASGEEAIGAMALYNLDKISFSQDHLRLLQTLVEYLAPVILETKKLQDCKPEDIIDSVTLVHRIPYMTAMAPQLISMASRNHSPLSLVYLEISSMYQVMRIYGGSVFNSLLRHIAQCIKSELRNSDILVRYGHQGFVAILPGVPVEHARRCVLRLRKQIQNEISAIGGQNFSVDCKAGIASYPKDGSTLSSLLHSAQESAHDHVSGDFLQDKNIVHFLPRA